MSFGDMPIVDPMLWQTETITLSSPGWLEEEQAREVVCKRKSFRLARASVDYAEAWVQDPATKGPRLRFWLRTSLAALTEAKVEWPSFLELPKWKADDACTGTLRESCLAVLGVVEGLVESRDDAEDIG